MRQRTLQMNRNPVARAPTSEYDRLNALRAFEILDTPPEPQFDRLVRIASHTLKAPISLISLIDESRQWFKAKHGLALNQTPRSIAFCSHTIQDNKVMVVEDATADDRFWNNPLVIGSPEVRFYAGAPLRTRKGFKLGTLCVFDRVPRSISIEQKELLHDLAAVVVDEMELHRTNIELTRLATTDPMTGVYNRRHFFVLAEREFARVRRHKIPATVLMIDIDHFKRVNDTYGHAVGDRAIMGTMALAKQLFRHEDVLGRIGGEEFSILMPETAPDDALVVAERVCDAVRNARIEVCGTSFSTTVSIGVSGVNPTDATIEDALKRADEALYVAKRSGRDRVELA